MESNYHTNQDWNNPENNPSHLPKKPENHKILAGVLAILLGSFGIHKFILGIKNEGIILLAITLIGYATLCIGVGAILISATSLIGLIEGIIYLTKSDEEFYQTYQINKKPWF